MNMKIKLPEDEKDEIFFKISDLIKFSRTLNNSTLSRSHFTNFQYTYQLVTHKVDGYVCVKLKDLEACKKIIEDKYFNEGQKINVKSTLIAIKKWCKVVSLYLEHKRTELEGKKDISKVDFNMSIYDMLNKEKKLISFQAAYLEYKNVYMIPTNEVGSIEQFAKFMELNYYKLDMDEFLTELYLIQNKKDKKCN